MRRDALGELRLVAEYNTPLDRDVGHHLLHRSDAVQQRRLRVTDRVATVAIGRNEGERLVRALAALAAQKLSPIVYVDSNSTDASIEEAQKIGADVVEIDMSLPFTAARARNAGWRRVLEIAPDTATISLRARNPRCVSGCARKAGRSVGSMRK